MKITLKLFMVSCLSLMNIAYSMQLSDDHEECSMANNNSSDFLNGLSFYSPIASQIHEIEDPVTTKKELQDVKKELQGIKEMLVKEQKNNEELQQAIKQLSLASPNKHDHNSETISLYNDIVALGCLNLYTEIPSLLAYYQDNKENLKKKKTEYKTLEEDIAQLQYLYKFLSIYFDKATTYEEQRSKVTLQKIGTLIHQCIPIIHFLQDQIKQGFDVLDAAAQAGASVEPQISLAKKFLKLTMIGGLVTIAIVNIGNYLDWWVVGAPSNSIIDFLDKIWLFFKVNITNATNTVKKSFFA